jgi:hypothetical protein
MRIANSLFILSLSLRVCSSNLPDVNVSLSLSLNQDKSKLNETKDDNFKEEKDKNDTLGTKMIIYPNLKSVIYIFAFLFLGEWSWLGY